MVVQNKKGERVVKIVYFIFCFYTLIIGLLSIVKSYGSGDEVLFISSLAVTVLWIYACYSEHATYFRMIAPD